MGTITGVHSFFAFCDDFLSTYANIMAFQIKACYSYAKNTDPKSMNLPDQQFIIESSKVIHMCTIDDFLSIHMLPVVWGKMVANAHEHKEKQRMKKGFLLILTVGLLISILVLPASAAESWRTEMGSFKPVSEYYASYYPKYLWALQRFLFSYPDTQDEMAGSTHDGIWGSKTRAAVGAYQKKYHGD